MPAAAHDGEHVGVAVAGEIAKPQLIHRKRGTLHRLPIDVRQRGHEPLASFILLAAYGLGPPERMGGAPSRAYAMVALARIEASELDVFQLRVATQIRVVELAGPHCMFAPS